MPDLLNEVETNEPFVWLIILGSLVALEQIPLREQGANYQGETSSQKQLSLSHRLFPFGHITKLYRSPKAKPDTIDHHPGKESYFSMDLSIAIVNWNTREILRQCLESVYTYPPSGTFEVWVVDNASTDGSQAMVMEHFPKVRLVENQKNVGFASANNLAIRQASGRYVLLLNSDTIVKPNALEALIRLMDEHEDTGACGPRLLNPDGTLQYSCYFEPTLGKEFLRLFHLGGLRYDGSYPMSRWDLEKIQEVDVIQGAALMLRKQALDQIGLLDESFFMYSEDFDLCYRIQKSNWRLFWVPWSEIVHFGGQSTKLVAADMFLHLYQSKMMFVRKHYGRYSANVYKLILLFAALSRLILMPLSWLEPPQTRQRHLVVSNNYRRLIISLTSM